MANVPLLKPRGAFAGILPPLAGHGITIIERDGLGLATVQVRSAKLEELKRRAHESFGIELPDGPSRVGAGDVAFAGTGQGAWLASREARGNAFAASLVEALGDCAAVADQSDGFGVLRLSGACVRDLLCRLVPVDVHAREFKVGDVASTLAGHIGVTLWRLEDRSDGTAAFEIALYRSFAGSFARALCESVAGMKPQ